MKPTGLLPAAMRASFTSVIMAATVGVAPEVPLSKETVPLLIFKNKFLFARMYVKKEEETKSMN